MTDALWWSGSGAAGRGRGPANGWAITTPKLSLS